ncbi:MAG: hypothetical protein PVH12_07140 [Candidatus Bathyarchaeota archaeon]|jgi:hypothetical protein
MSEYVRERRLRGIAKQIGLLKSEIRTANKKTLILFFAGLAIGLVTNIFIELICM